MKKLNILIIGSGLYVSGKGTNNFGTILPAILQEKRKGNVSGIGICATSIRSIKDVKNKLEKLCKMMSISSNCKYYPNENSKKHDYIYAIKNFNPDAVIISVPDHLHYKISMDVLKFKKHCLLVKPMTNKLLQAKEMIAEAKRAQVVAQVEFHKRLDESNLILKDKINNNELGEILYSTIEYSQQKKLPELHFKKWSQETNVFNYLGVHYVDLLYFLTEYKPKFVSAWGQKTYLNKRGIDTWDSIQVVIEWYKLKKSFVSTHITNWIDPNTSSAISDQKISIVGTNGRYSADQKNRGIETVNDTDGPSTLNPYFSQIYGDQKKGRVKFDGYGIRNIAQFCSDIIKLNEKTITLKSLDTIRPSFKNSLISTAVIEAVERSLRSENRKIKVIL